MHCNWHYFWRQYVYPRLRRKPKCRANWNCHSGAYRVISRPLDMAAGQEKKRNQNMKRIIMKDISLHKQSPYRSAQPVKEKRAIQLTARATLNLVCHKSKYVGLKPVSMKIYEQNKPKHES